MRRVRSATLDGPRRGAARRDRREVRDEPLGRVEADDRDAAEALEPEVHERLGRAAHDGEVGRPRELLPGVVLVLVLERGRVGRALDALLEARHDGGRLARADARRREVDRADAVHARHAIVGRGGFREGRARRHLPGGGLFLAHEEDGEEEAEDRGDGDAAVHGDAQVVEDGLATRHVRENLGSLLQQTNQNGPGRRRGRPPLD